MPRSEMDREIEQQYESGDLRLTQERNDFLLPQVIDFVKRKSWLNLRPEYQRRLVWDKRKKSLFIESLLMNVPVPPVFLYEYDLSRYEVMDGQQRLNAIIEFYQNKLTLTGLETWEKLNGRRRSECPPLIRRGLDRRRISATVLVAETKVGADAPFDVRREVFERLNTGGQQLNAHELRNALYSGPFNKLLIALASGRTFRRMWGIPTQGHGLSDYPLYRRMTDCEIVLRFFAFRNVGAIKGSVRGMLDACMVDLCDIRPTQVTTLRQAFTSRLEVVRRVFGEGAFSLEEEGRSRPSPPLYDAFMVAIDRLWEDRASIQKKRVKVAREVRQLLQKPRVYELVVGRANTAKALKARIHVVEAAIGRHV